MRPIQHHVLRPLAAFLAVLALTALATVARAQEADSTWDDLGLDPEGFKYDEEIFGHVSTGWFPQAYTGYTLSFTSEFLYADVFDDARGIRPRSFQATTEPFTSSNPFNKNEREIYQPYKDEEEDDGYPVTDYTEYGLTFLYNLPMPAVLRLGGSFRITEGMLFSRDTSRSFLTLRGVAQPFKEVGVVYLKEQAITGSAGINIPVYGGFIRSEALVLSSYYYVYAGYSASYALYSRGTQYAQIADAKDDLRYGNGADTVTLMQKAVFDNLNRFRTSLDFAIGWHLASDFGTIGVEAFVSVPQHSVLKDVEWKQYFTGLRFSAGWHWLPTRRDTSSISPP